MADRDESFLHRWSRLKRSEQEEMLAPQPEPQRATQLSSDPSAVPAATAGELADDHAAQKASDAALPPIESLDRDSDYTAFMRAGVAPELRRQALRKLWRSDPVFANLDGLLEYGEDYSAPFKRGGVVSTLYQVGKGMLAPAEDSAAEPAMPSAADNSASADSGAPSAGNQPEPVSSAVEIENSANAKKAEDGDDRRS